MYTIINKKLPAILSCLGHRYDYRNLAKKLNTLILAALICAPGVAFSALSVVTVVVDDNEATEAGPGTGSFTIFRSNNGDIAGDLKVPLVFSGTAEHGPDYTLSNINCCFAVVIPAGLLSTTVTLTPVFDNNVEGTEEASISLAASSEYELGDGIEAVIEITDDAAVVTLVANDSEASEAGSQTGSFTVSRTSNGKLAADLSVPLSFSGSADQGLDYTLGNVICCSSVVIPAGMLSTVVTLTPIPDGEVEGDEIAEISLVAGDSYLLGEPSMASITIADLLDIIFRDGFE